MSALQTILKWFRRPLSCEDVNQFIIDYLEQTLPAHVRAQFETHLENCPDCGPYFDQYLQTVEFIKEDGQLRVDPPEALVASTLHFLRQHYDDWEPS